MEKALIVVDYQNDFITGSLGTPEAQAILPNVIERVRCAEYLGESVIFTRDFHTDDISARRKGSSSPYRIATGRLTGSISRRQSSTPPEHTPSVINPHSAALISPDVLSPVLENR